MEEFALRVDYFAKNYAVNGRPLYYCSITLFYFFIIPIFVMLLLLKPNTSPFPFI